MQHFETIHTETVDGFDITYSVTYEDTHPRDCFDDSEFDIQEMCEKIDRGYYFWFVAKVTASKNEIELASDYLGCNLYENVMDFVKDNDYYRDMVETVLKEAKSAIHSLTLETV
jgi:hypothetical protein